MQPQPRAELMSLLRDGLPTLRERALKKGKARLAAAAGNVRVETSGETSLELDIDVPTELLLDELGCVPKTTNTP